MSTTARLVRDQKLFDRLVEIRRDLHRHPELSWHETRTAERIAAVLDDLGVAYRAGVARTGVVAELPGPHGVPAVVLRADTDALPIQEETDLDFASVHDGVMHACAHDGHTTMLLGAAALLAATAHRPAPVRLVFQPAEETGAGAPAMIEAGVLENAGAIFGGHIDRLYDAGTIIVHEGAVNASTDEFVIELTAAGGHGARPHESPDPIVVGAHIVGALQTIVARQIDPTKAAVVSVGRFHAGTAPNVIASRARLEGTLRAQEPEVRAQLTAAVSRIARQIAEAHGVRVGVEVAPGTPPVVNTAASAALAREAAAAAVGPDGVTGLRTGNMGGEDFGFYLEHLPGCYVRFGARPGGQSFPAHSSRFVWDERVLSVGAEYYRHVALIAGRALARNGQLGT